MENKNGLLIDEHGVIRGIEIAISNCPLSGLPRRAYHAGFSDNRELQMVHSIGVITLSADGSETISDSIQQVIIDQRRKNTLLDRYRDDVLMFCTEGAFVDPATGTFVSPETEGAMEQLAYLQQISPAMMRKKGMPINRDGTTPHLLATYMMYVAEIQTQDALGRL